MGPAQLSTFSSKHGPSRCPARPSAGPLVPSECCPRSCSLPQARIHWAELCCLPLMGPPKRGLKLPPQPGGFPRAEPCLPLRQGVPPERAVTPSSDEGPPAWAALPGPAPAGSERLSSAVPSPGRWQPGCAVCPSTSLKVPSSPTPSGTGPGRGREQTALGAWLVMGACLALPRTLP